MLDLAPLAIWLNGQSKPHAPLTPPHQHSVGGAGQPINKDWKAASLAYRAGPSLIRLFVLRRLIGGLAGGGGVKGRRLSLKLQAEWHLAKDEAEGTQNISISMCGASHFARTDGRGGEKEGTIFIKREFESLRLRKKTIMASNKAKKKLNLKGPNKLIRLMRGMKRRGRIYMQ